MSVQEGAIGPGRDGPSPGHGRLGESLAARLAAIGGLAPEQLKGPMVAGVAKAFPSVIDPQFLLFRQVWGTVVKTDPAMGFAAPAPFARVQLEDPDCSFLSDFPAPSPWGWIFPFQWRREVIASGFSDEGGRFCVWIPRWSIDWLLRFRHERRCFGVSFERSLIQDRPDQLLPPVAVEGPPRPHPCPIP